MAAPLVSPRPAKGSVKVSSCLLSTLEVITTCSKLPDLHPII